MSDLSKLDSAIKDAEERFNRLGAEISTRKEKVAELNREMAGFLEEQVRIQGEWRVLDKLKKGSEAPPEETIH